MLGLRNAKQCLCIEKQLFALIKYLADIYVLKIKNNSLIRANVLHFYKSYQLLKL